MKSFILCLALLLSIQVSSQTIVDKTIVSGGITRLYKLYIPAMYNGTSPVPLVLNLHGLGSNSLQQMVYGDFRTIADTANFIIVHPQGTTNPTLALTYWNAYFGGAVNDINFLSELIDTISNNYKIDVNRIHSTGMSNGGYMSLVLAAGLDDKIASVASVTGSMTVSFPVSPVNTKPISVLQIHGTADSTVKYMGDINSKSIQNVLNYWISHNNTTTTPAIYSIPNISTIDGCTATRYIYNGGNNNTEVVHYKVTGGAHTWPNSVFTIGVTNRDFDASQVIWAFFNKHQKTNTVSLKKIIEPKLISFINDVNNSRIILKSNTPNSRLTYTIFDITGKKVSENSFLNETTEINMQPFNAGMYVLRVNEINTSKISSFKFVVR